MFDGLSKEDIHEAFKDAIKIALFLFLMYIGCIYY